MRLSKKIYLRVVQVAVSGFIILYLLRILDWPAVKEVLCSGILLSLWPGPLLLLLGLLLAAERWCSILAALNVTLSRYDALILYLIGNFYSVLLPGVLGGDLVRAVICRRWTGGTVASVVASIGIERGLGLWGITLLGSIGALAVYIQIPVEIDTATLLLSPFLACGIPLTTLGAYLVVRHTDRVTGNSNWIARISTSIRTFAERLRQIPLRITLHTLFVSTAFQTSEILIYFYFGRVVGIDVPFVFFLFAIPLVYLATVLPISLGGIGVREGVLVWLLSLSGTSSSDAVILALLVYVNRIFVGVIGGAAQLKYAGQIQSWRSE